MNTRTKIFVGVFLAIQVGLPLRYYLRDYRLDERFAWRMFVTPNVKTCTPNVTWKVFGQEETVPMRALLHPAWISNIRENKVEIIEPYLRRLCREPHVSSVVLVNNCEASPGKVTTHVYSEICQTPDG